MNLAVLLFVNLEAHIQIARPCAHAEYLQLPQCTKCGPTDSSSLVLFLGVEVLATE
jgi:hypothetical protein